MFDRHTAGGRARVMIGHSYAPKRDRIEQLGAALKLLAQRGARFSSLGEQARLLREDPVLRDELGALASYGARARIAPEELWQRIGTQRQRTLQLIAGRLDALKPRGEPLRIADVGCGTGELVTFPLLYLLRDRPVEMHGVDTDAASIERAWEGAASYGLEGRVAFQSGSADQLKGMFDAVICAHVLDRVDDPPALLRDASALVAPEGLLLVVSANGASYSHRERRLVTGLYNFILRQPMAVRHAAVRAKRLLGALRRRPQTGPVARAPLGTLNFASEEVVSPLSKGRLLRLLGQAGLAPAAIENLAALGGILGRRLDHLAGWAGNPSKLPSALASEWLVIARRKNP
jgi:2-polyprenyl-3-methyl-5-hydroxy-6-metoxy-1,4-benzoquinol methylase